MRDQKTVAVKISEEPRRSYVVEVDEFLRLKDLRAVTGLSPTAIKDLVRRGEFPQPIRLTDAAKRAAKAWSLREVAQWQRDRIAKRGRK